MAAIASFLSNCPSTSTSLSSVTSLTFMGPVCGPVSGRSTNRPLAIGALAPGQDRGTPCLPAPSMPEFAVRCATVFHGTAIERFRHGRAAAAALLRPVTDRSALNTCRGREGGGSSALCHFQPFTFVTANAFFRPEVYCDSRLFRPCFTLRK